MTFSLGPITKNPFNVTFVQEWAYFYGHDKYELRTVFKKVNLDNGKEVNLRANSEIKVWENLSSDFIN